jgi:nucleoid DNA-binding protein
MPYSPHAGLYTALRPTRTASCRIANPTAPQDIVQDGIYQNLLPHNNLARLLNCSVMNKTQLALAIATDTGLAKTPTFDILTAITLQLEAEGQAGRAVVLEHFGTMLPRYKAGQRTGYRLGGGTVTYDNWKLVPQPEMVDELSFIHSVAQRAQTKPPLVAIVLQNFKMQVVRTLRRGGGVHNHGHGTFKPGRQKTRTYHHADGSISSKVPPKLVVVYRAAKGGWHQKFVPLPGLI